MLVCEKCGKQFSTKVIIGNKVHHVSRKRKYCTECVPLYMVPRSKIDFYTRDELQSMLDTSSSYAEVLLNCGLTANNNNYNTLNRAISKYGLDLGAIKQNRKNAQSRKQTKYTEDNIGELITLGLVKKRPSELLNIIVKYGIKEYKCECCGVVEWQNKHIRLELHHKDGDRLNNCLSNLEILCPNCHSQTDNFRFKNRTKRGRIM